MALQGQLLKILRGRDISSLFEIGSLEVRGDDRGPTKTVFLIEEIGDEIVEVPLHRVNQIQLSAIRVGYDRSENDPFNLPFGCSRRGAGSF